MIEACDVAVHASGDLGALPHTSIDPQSHGLVWKPSLYDRVCSCDRSRLDSRKLPICRYFLQEAVGHEWATATSHRRQPDNTTGRFAGKSPSGSDGTRTRDLRRDRPRRVIRRATTGGAAGRRTRHGYGDRAAAGRITTRSANGRSPERSCVFHAFASAVASHCETGLQAAQPPRRRPVPQDLRKRVTVVGRGERVAAPCPSRDRRSGSGRAVRALDGSRGDPDGGLHVRGPRRPWRLR